MTTQANHPTGFGEQNDAAATHLAAALASMPPDSSPYAVLRISLGFGRTGSFYEDSTRQSLLAQSQLRLQTSIREHETAVLLPEGELLVLLCSVRSVIRAGAAADRLADLLQEPFCFQGQRIRLVASVGVALAPEDGKEASVLAHRAGVALRRAEAAGTGIVQFYDTAMESPSRQPQSLHARKALLFQNWQGSHPTQLNISGLSIAASSTGLHLV